MRRSKQELDAMRRVILENRREQRNTAIQQSNDLRKKYLPHGISLILIGLSLFIFQILVTGLSSEISSGNVHNNEMIGPIEISSKSLYNLSVEHDVSKYSNNWCNLSMLLLDENKTILLEPQKTYITKEIEMVLTQKIKRIIQL